MSTKVTATQEGDDRQRADHYQHLYEQASEGKCGHSGLPLAECKRSICDCIEFGWVATKEGDQERDALAEVLTDVFDEWLFRMHGVTSSCDHRDEGEALADAVLAAGWRPPGTDAAREALDEYPAGHGFTPGKFSGGCRMMLAKYSCNWEPEQHDPSLPPEDLDHFGYRRDRRTETGQTP